MVERLPHKCKALSSNCSTAKEIENKLMMITNINAPHVGTANFIN
jgi:hypothetical protein